MFLPAVVDDDDIVVVVAVGSVLVVVLVVLIGFFVNNFVDTAAICIIAGLLESVGNNGNDQEFA